MKQGKTPFISLTTFTNDIFNHSFARFLLIGAFNTVFGWIIYGLFLFAFHHQIAYALTYMIGIIGVSYINPRYVFKVKSTAFNGVKTALTYGFQYILGAFLLEMVVRFAGVSPFIALIIVTCITVPVTFGINYILLRKDILGKSNKY